VEGLGFTVRATDEVFLELLRAYLPEFRVERAEAVNHFSADVGPDTVLPGGKVIRGKSRLYLGGLKIFEGTERDEMAGRIISGVRDLATQHSNEFVRVRAGGVVVEDRALLLPSVPEPHLPALVASMVRRGAGYLGDELISIDPVLRLIHGSVLPLLVDTVDVGLFPEVGRRPGRQRLALLRDPDRIGARTPRRPVRVQELFGASAGPTPPGRVVFPVFRPGRPTELQDIGAAEALFEFTQAVLNLHVWTDRALVVMRDILTSVPAARLVVGSIPEAADLLVAAQPEATVRG
jgi:hypothetical protein